LNIRKTAMQIGDPVWQFVRPPFTDVEHGGDGLAKVKIVESADGDVVVDPMHASILETACFDVVSILLSSQVCARM